MELLGKNTCNHVVGNPAISYTLANCPRCLGKGVYGDVSFDNAGRLNILNNVLQLNQQIEKTLTENKRPSGYGFDYTLLSGTIDSGKTLAIKREVTRVINYLINVQQNEKASGFYYRTTEEIFSLDSVDVYQDPSEPRQVIIITNITTVSGNLKTVSVPLKR